MNAPSLERFERAWGCATEQTPIDEQRSLVRLLESLGSERKPSERRFLPRASSAGWLAAAAALALTVGVGGYVYHRLQRPVLPVDAGVVAGTWLETRRDERLPMHFTEGSEVVVAESSRVRVGGDSPKGAQVTVDRGSVRANIVHRKDSRWAFVAGPFNVRVTGTRLRVDWLPERGELQVAVDEGSVVAEGPLLGDGRVIRQGESCRVSVKNSVVYCTAPKSAPNGATGASPAASVPEAAGSAAARDINDLPLLDASDDEANETALKQKGPGTKTEGGMLELERAGKYAEALTLAKQIGVPRLLAAGRAEELFCLSRLGRYQGNTSLSREALVRIRDRFGQTKEAALAAFLLGRQSAPAEAARWFSTYLAEQPQGAFAREASGRLVESYHRAGRFGDAQAAARRYLSSYPAGPHAEFAKSLLANL